MKTKEASRSAGAQSVTVNLLIVGSIPTRGDEIFTKIYISIRFPLLILLRAGYSVKLIYLFILKVYIF